MCERCATREAEVCVGARGDRLMPGDRFCRELGCNERAGTPEHPRSRYCQAYAVRLCEWEGRAASATGCGAWQSPGGCIASSRRCWRTGPGATTRARRWCFVCGTRLSGYNRGTECGPCEYERKQRSLAGLARMQESG